MANIYPPCQCTWYCANRCPWCLRYGNLTDALNWAREWASHGGVVTGVPTVNSIACFQPGEDEAGAAGHVAVVVAVASGGRAFTVNEVDVPFGNCNVNIRTVALVPGIRFLLNAVPAPPPPSPEAHKVLKIFWVVDTTHNRELTALLSDGLHWRWLQSLGDIAALETLYGATLYRPAADASVFTKAYMDGFLGAPADPASAARLGVPFP